MSVYAVFTEDGLDQIVETKAIAEREQRDLRKMGCTVNVKEFATESAALDYADRKYR